MLKSKFKLFFSCLFLALSISTFIYSTSYANPTTCPICAGQTGPVQDQDCEEVNIGGAAWCFESHDGTCEHSGLGCD